MKNVNINSNINYNSYQNSIQKKDNNNYKNNYYSNNNQENNENNNYPDFEELNLEKNINYEKEPNIEVFESKDESFDIEIPNFKPMDIEVFSDVDKFMKENCIQDDYNDKDENENKTYKK